MEYIFDLKPYELDVHQIKKYYGSDDINLKTIEKYFKVSINANSETLSFSCDEKTKDLIFKVLILMIDSLDDIDINNIINNVVNENLVEQKNLKFVITYNNNIIRPKNHSQLRYYYELENNTIIFAMGAAGTGKTFLAVAYAINMLKLKKVSKIIITRPIVEAGENLGFLPGELQEKVDPYLIPIYDALNFILGQETVKKYLEKQIIEIAPLAYMRGRTLNDACIILDEAQNTTATQMKMFLTRLGNNAKMIITGDESQIDLKASQKSGIVHASEILTDIEGISFIKFSSKDVVRNPLVAKIIKAYNQNSSNK